MKREEDVIMSLTTTAPVNGYDAHENMAFCFFFWF